MDWEKDICKRIGQHARLNYQELEQEPPSRPLDFPAPTVHRGARIAAKAYDSKRGKYIKLKNLLVRCNQRGSRGGNVTATVYGAETEQNEIGYCIRRKLSSTVFGAVYKGVVMKKRPLLSGEITMIQQEGIHEKNSRGSLSSILEDIESEENERFQTAATSSSISSSFSSPDFSPGSSTSGVWESTNEYVIVKASSWAKIRRLRGKHLEDPIKEIQCMQLLGNYHSHFVSHIDALQDDYYLYNVMQYCEDGDLHSVVMSEINKNGRVEECRARIWFRQLLWGLHHLQQKGVCHRDLSLENIMVHKQSIKIVDFGLALRVPFTSLCTNGNRRYVTDVSEGSTRLLMTAQGQCANWTYMSPEVLQKDENFDGFTHDLWAAGVILYILLVGHKPFHWAHKTDKEFLQISVKQSLKESLLYWKIDLSEDAFDLLQNMLLWDPGQRLTLAEVMQHPWVKDASMSHEISESNNDDTSTGTKKIKPKWFHKKQKGKNKK